jgi:hypothetical protein
MALLNISPLLAVTLTIVHSSMDMGVEAHGDVSHIAEGESVSKEPIVGFPKE